MHTDSPERGRAREILDADAFGRTLARLAHELIERNDDVPCLALVGIHTRGVPLAQRLQALVAERSGVEPELGAVDTTIRPRTASAVRETRRGRDGAAVAVSEPVTAASSLPCVCNV